MLRYELKAAFSDTNKTSIRSNSLVTAILDISENRHIFKKAHGNMNIQHQLPMRSVFFFFVLLLTRTYRVGEKSEEAKAGDRARPRERMSSWLCTRKRGAPFAFTISWARFPRKRSAGNYANILKHAVFKWRRFSWRLWSRKDRVKDVKNHGCFVKQNIEVSDAWKNAYPVSAGTDKRLPYARTESVIGLCFLLLTHAQYTVHTDISFNVNSRIEESLRDESVMKQHG